jgi:hypothetical protein
MNSVGRARAKDYQTDGRQEPAADKDAATRLNLWPAADLPEHETANPCLRIVMDWIHTYVLKPHNQLGRGGPVCPFVSPALSLKALWISVVDREFRSEKPLRTVLNSYIEQYHLSEPRGAGRDLKAFIIVFPKLVPDRASNLVDQVHKSMKPMVVEAGLMLGEFHRGSQSPGLHNSHFYPLRSPVPLFVLRKMVPGDLVFLNKVSDPPALRIQFLRAYLKNFEGSLSAEWATNANTALAALQSQDQPRGGSNLQLGNSNV